MDIVNTHEKTIIHQTMLAEKDVRGGLVYRIIKRIIDISLAIVGLICLFPVLIIVALLIKSENMKGSVLFSQIRIGKKGKAFKLYKFRSMVIDAEEKLEDLVYLNEVTGAMFKIKEDPRVTRVGKIIRRTSIDELPQLWNVLLGEMSIVGPRPPLPREVEIYTTFQKQRLLVTPGCTGLWQVRGRSNLNFDKMVELDLYYIQKRSVWLDMKIIVVTVFQVLMRRGAF